MVNFTPKDKYTCADLREIVSLLRGEGGCPWDREQTHESIRRNVIEEAYEAAEAIDEKSAPHLQEELGDLLLQVMFHSDIEEKAGSFDLDDVADMECKKLIFRHPHVFGDVEVKDSGEVLVNWDELKRQEKSQETYTDTLNSVARSLPSLWRAEKVQSKAAKAGFDWPDVSGALDKLSEEIEELRRAVQSGKGVCEELGDVMFSAVNAARFLSIDPEDALNSSTDKFIRRFAGLERAALEQGLRLETMTLAEMDNLYNIQKEKEKKQ
ncbi:MAG: nucleoside triphosphate pyrophosphohydrolase [Oscillospiraceae bacterium]|nr:nucleoside triphosphate pyrophosphohydrolase [Oscillospiraceae bacterium]